MRLLLAVSAALLASATLATATLGPGTSPVPAPVTYAGSGVLVAKEAGIDNGVVVCSRPGLGLGVGGGCLPFGDYAFIGVRDAALGGSVAFQVCIDNNGDSLCTGPAGTRCDDDVFFSHDDRGRFFNPLGPLPGGFRPGCHGGPWKGYVVFLCEGVHTSGGPHGHAATGGTIAPAFVGSGYGDFCLPEPKPPAKRYVVL